MWHESVVERPALTAAVPVDAVGVQLRLSGVGGRVWASVQRSQRLQHAEETVGRWKLQVFLWDVAHLSCLIASLKHQTWVIKHLTWDKNFPHTCVCSDTLTQSSMSPSSITSSISCSSIVNSSGWEAWNTQTRKHMRNWEMIQTSEDWRTQDWPPHCCGGYSSSGGRRKIIVCVCVWEQCAFAPYRSRGLCRLVDSFWAFQKDSSCCHQTLPYSPHTLLLLHVPGPLSPIKKQHRNKKHNQDLEKF